MIFRKVYKASSSFVLLSNVLNDRIFRTGSSGARSVVFPLSI